MVRGKPDGSEGIELQKYTIMKRALDTFALVLRQLLNARIGSPPHGVIASMDYELVWGYAV